MCYICQAARRCIRGDYGTGNERVRRLIAEDYCPGCVQTVVNDFLGSPYYWSHCPHDLSDYCSTARSIMERYWS